MKKKVIITVCLVIFVIIGVVLSINNIRDNASLTESDTPETAETTEATETDVEGQDDAASAESLPVDDTGDNVISISPEDISCIQITASDGTLVDASLDTRTGDWVLTDDPEVKLKKSEIDKIFNIFAQINAIDYIENGDPTQYGLAEETYTYTVIDGSNQATIITLGDADDKGQYYIINHDTSVIYVNGGFLTALKEINIADLIQVN